MAPESFEQVMPRPHTFMKPFVRIFQGQAADQHTTTSVCGLRSNVERQNIASLASRFGQSRLPRQSFMGWDAWDDAPWREEVRSPGKTPLGPSEGVFVCDPAGFPKSGRESVGVARQWCGRLGKVDHGQVAISVGYGSRKGHTLVDPRLSLPKAWTKEQARLARAGVPKASRAYRTRHQVALERLAPHGTSLPHRWLAGDDEIGRR
jgi:SRSO17 transposase